MATKIFLNSYLLLLFFSVAVSANAQSTCKEIKATIEVFQAGEKAEKGSIKIDFHGQASSNLDVTLMGPNGYLKKEIQENELTGLEEGTYTLVFTARKREDNFCVKYFEFTIKK